MRKILQSSFLATAQIVLLLLSTCVARAQPANDNFANAIVISGYVAKVTGSNINATTESTETSNWPYPGEFGGHSVWWTWTSPSNGVVSVDTQGSSFETELMIFNGTSLLTNLLVNYDNDSGSNHTSALEFSAIAGATYQIWVDGWNGATGLIVLHLNYPIIMSQSLSQTNVAGDTTTLSVSATGTNLTYQWYFGQTGDASAPISDATNATYTTSPLLASGNFWVRVGNALASANSATIALTVLPRVAIPVINPNGGTIASPTSIIMNCDTVGANIYFTLDGSPPTTNSTLYSEPFDLSQPATIRAMATASNSIQSLFATAIFWAPTVVAWGEGNSGDATVPIGLNNVVAVSGGAEHSLALKSDGTIAAWGENLFGQISVPGGLSHVTAVAAGGAHSLALVNSTVVGWGTNLDGQVTVPASATNVSAIAAGGAFSLALKKNGTVLAWGNNGWGQTNVPARLTNVQAIAAGQYHALALQSNGTVVAWGLNASGQTSVPAGLTNVIAIAAGAYHSLSLKSDGTVTAWGDNSSGQLNVPAGLTNVIAIAAGAAHSAALKSNNTLVLWGDNFFGQSESPPELTGALTLAAGYYDNLVIAFPTNVPPAITSNPQSITIFSNQTTVLSVIANGLGLVYQWYIGNSGDTSNPVSTATNASFTTTQLTATTAYWVSVSNVAGSTNSSTAIVTVVPPTPPAIASQPQSVTNSYGTSATLAVLANGLQLAYQWYSGNSGDTSHPISGATLANYATPVLPTTTSYWVLVSNPVGDINSTTAVVTILPPSPPVITIQPQSVTNNYNASASFSISATGIALNYQWYVGNSGDTSNPINNATANNYITPNLTNTTAYWVSVSNSGGTANSATAIATILPVSTNNLVWKGGSSNAWDIGITTNWLNGFTSHVFNNGNDVTFNDVGSNNTPIVLTGTLQPASITVAAAKNYIWGGSGLIGGTNSLSKSGGGSLTLTNTGNNSFSGGVTINGGIVALGVDSGASGNPANENPLGLGVGPVQVNTGGQLRFGGKSGSVQNYFITNTITLNGGTIFSADGRQFLTNSILNITTTGGTLFTRWSGKDLVIGSQLAGSGPLTMDYGGGASTPGALVYLSNPLNTYSGIFSVNAYSVVLNNTYALSHAIFNPVGTGANLTWSGITNIVLGGLMGTGNINLGANQLEVGNNDSNSTYVGILSGSGNLVKIGAGILTLTGVNTYSGSTTVSNGILLIDGNSGSSPISITSGGTLGGSGSIGGPVVINDGGSLAPGDGVGTLIINNNLALSNVSTLHFDLGPLYASDTVQVSGSLTLGGILNVTAASGFSPNIYPLFTYDGVLNGQLPQIGSFPPDQIGIISTNIAGEVDLIVEPRTAPRISSVTMTPDAVVLIGSNGPPNYNYYLLSSTNLETPSTQWTRIATNIFDAAGKFALTNTAAPNAPRYFYLLQLAQ